MMAPDFAVNRGEAKQTVVLVVEDDVLIRLNNTAILEEAGYRVFAAGDAQEALAILQQEPAIHLLFSDIDMPGGMNGIALAELVQRRWPNTRILLGSGQHWISDRAVPNEGRFLRKPYADELVIEEVGALLGA